MWKRLAVVLGLVGSVQVAYAQDRDALVGVWKLMTWEYEFQDTGERRAVFGRVVNGFLIIAREGRMMVTWERVKWSATASRRPTISQQPVVGSRQPEAHCSKPVAGCPVM